MKALTIEEANALMWEWDKVAKVRKGPMVNAIIGSKGFIGSRLKWYADNFLEDEWIGIHRDNARLWQNTRFKNIIWAAGSPRKDLSPRQLIGENYWAVREALAGYYYDKFIYISSQAVYADDVAKPNEDHEPNYYKLSDYGKSKIKGEWTVKDQCETYGKDYLIIRPNGFVGPGLKKNVIHSLAKDPPELYYTWDSKFQVIHTDIFATIVFMLASSFSGEIFNVTSEQVITSVDVARMMGVDIKSVVQPKDHVLPHVSAIMDTSKLDTILKEANITLPSTEEAISKWNEPFEVRMHRVSCPMGQSK
jgi:nucleoside-diphosphate-sugar epimerase